MNIELKKLSVQNRIELLSKRAGKENQAIIRKLRRKLRAL